MTAKPFLLGLTGSIGMGKSTTADMFRELDIPVWDADATVADLYKSGGAAIEPMRALVPEAVGPGGIDKAALKRAISNDQHLLSKIEKIVHPLVAQHRSRFIKDNSESKLIVLDIPLLFETGAEKHIDAVLVVSAPAEIQRDRVLSRGTMSQETFDLILSRQTPDAEKRLKADYIIETLTLDDTKAKVSALVDKLVNPS